MLRLRPHGSALRVALIYLAFSAVWILFSDRAVTLLASDLQRYVWWQTAKGLGFVLVSALILYGLVRREQRTAGWQEELFRNAVSLFPDPVLLRRLSDGRIVAANEPFARTLDRTTEEILGRTLEEVDFRPDREQIEAVERRLEETGLVVDAPVHVMTHDGVRHSLLVSSRQFELDGGRYRLSVGKDVTELERTRETLEEQLRRLRALRDIDRAITGSLDLDLTLEVVLEQVTERLELDAAALLLSRGPGGALEFAAGLGFRTEALRHTTLEPGEGLAGRAAAERRTIRVAPLEEQEALFERAPLLAEEGFVAYRAVPLEARGEVVGVLELFSRRHRQRGEGWEAFLEALAGQAAIAVDSAAMVERIRASNRNLRAAYDATIRGWSRALDLRDRETQGHTERVTELTVRLCRRLGMEEEAIVHARRGALLHDMGKLGVPDAILFKEGPLDDDEWEVMRRHPTLAYRLLAPIGFLRPALEIPYAHHEKWDGTGYPRGLRGEEIPLAARIFAVVDVWDALRSDRPYREAWPEERVREHLRSEKGTHFEPRIVETFLEMLEELPDRWV